MNTASTAPDTIEPEAVPLMLHQHAQQGGVGRRYKNPTRPPLLLMTGSEDRICPPELADYALDWTVSHAR